MNHNKTQGNKRRVAVALALATWLTGSAVWAADKLKSDIATPPAVREKLSMDEGWKFALGNAADKIKDFQYCIGMPLAKAGPTEHGFGAITVKFDDSAWRTVDLPHDWAVELPFMTNKEYFAQTPWRVMDHGYKPVGPMFPETSIGWYRKSFAVPKTDDGRRISLVFDGSFRDTEVWLNGYRIGRHEGGYTGFRFDITDYLNYGTQNVLAVRVDATKFEGWFYEGAGLYRHVWLEKTGPLCVAPHGLKVVADATIGKVQGWVTIANSGESAPASLKARTLIFDADGQTVADQSGAVVIGENRLPDLSIPSPKLWSCDTPYLYRYVVELQINGATVDRVESTFGVRSMRFDPQAGFLLNGKRVQIKGACNHQDHAGVGVAVPDALLEWRLLQMKKWGFNAYRTSHNCPASELLDLCDKLGILVLDENRLIGSSPDNLRDLRFLVERDRNHPCVIAWSLGNEETVQESRTAARIGATMRRLVQQLDSSRPVTYGFNGGANTNGIMGIVDVFGINYLRLGKFDELHSKRPELPFLATEEGSTVSTRGIYKAAQGYVLAYDQQFPGWGNTAEGCMKQYAERPWLAGSFIWTGFDYRGEPTPYNIWPSISSHFGVLDTCGFPKDNAWYYKAWWTDEPVLHLLPHWNWQGKEGKEIDVRCYSNHEDVELFLNGTSLGRQTMPRLGHLAWKVKFAAGNLVAKGYRGGKVVEETEVATTGAPALLAAEPSKTVLKAGGWDCVVINVSLRDEQGRVVPTAGLPVRFQVSGGARILGVGNGDPLCHEADVVLPEQGKTADWKRSAFNGWCQVIVASPKQVGKFGVSLSSEGLKPIELEIRAE